MRGREALLEPSAIQGGTVNHVSAIAHTDDTNVEWLRIQYRNTVVGFDADHRAPMLVAEEAVRRFHAKRCTSVIEENVIVEICLALGRMP
jgi:hypothetical protein